MVIKQFKIGAETKNYLNLIRENIRATDFACDDTVRIENGFVLNKVVSSTDINDVDWKAVIEHKIIESNGTFVGETVKFKLSNETMEQINALVVLLSDTLNMRIYRAYAVKLFLKNYLINLEK